MPKREHVPPSGPNVFEGDPEDMHGVMIIAGFPGGKCLRFRSPMKRVRLCYEIPVTVIDMRDRVYPKRPLMPCPYGLD